MTNEFVMSVDRAIEARGGAELLAAAREYVVSTDHPTAREFAAYAGIGYDHARAVMNELREIVSSVRGVM